MRSARSNAAWFALGLALGLAAPFVFGRVLVVELRHRVAVELLILKAR